MNNYITVNPYVCPKCDGLKYLPSSPHVPCPTCNGTGVVFGPSNFSVFNIISSDDLEKDDVYTITQENLDKLLDSMQDYKSWSAVVNAFPLLSNENGSISVPERFVVHAKPDPETRNHNCWDCKRTKNECFNKKFVPKESSEGRDCKEWK